MVEEEIGEGEGCTEGEVRMLASSPLRSCTACRAQGAKADLLRFVLGPEGELVFDGQSKLPGRGAYTCPDPSCVRRAAERRGFERSFRCPVRPGNPDALLSRIRGWLIARILNLLGLARRSGRLFAGGDEVERAIGRGKLRVLVLAKDLAPRRLLELQAKAEGARVPVFFVEGMETLGRAVGRPPTGVLGLAVGPQLAPLLKAGSWLEKFGRASTAGDPGTLDPAGSDGQ